MSSLPPVTNTPHGSLADAINAALQSNLVFQDLSKLTSFRSDNFGVSSSAPHDTQNYFANATNIAPTVGSFSVGAHNLLLTDAGSNLTITPGDRGTFGSERVAAVVGGNSTIVFKNDTTNPAFGYDIVSGTGTNKITLNNGPDTFQSTSGNDLVKSGGGLDTIMGGSGHDTIYAGGQSYIQAGTSGDKIYGSTLPGGMDTIQAGAGADTIQLYAGSTSVIGSSGNTTLHAGTGNDTFDGSSATGNESILGGTGNLTANLSAQGNDTIFGQSGHDVAVNLDESFGGASVGAPDTNGNTTIHFSGGQTLEVKNVTISFNDGTNKHF